MNRDIKQTLFQSVPTWAGVVIVAATLVFWQALVTHGRTEIRGQTVAEAGRVHDKIRSHVLSQIFALEQMTKSWAIEEGMPQQRKGTGDYSADFAGYAALEWVEFPFRVAWMVPIQGEEEAGRGYRLSSEEMQARVREAVQSKRKVSMTRSFNLADGHKAFMICRPVFAKARSSGFLVAVGVFRLAEMLDSLLRDDRRRGYCIRIREGGSRSTAVLKKAKPRGRNGDRR